MSITPNPTPYSRLARPDFDISPWHDDVNENFSKIDAALNASGAPIIDGTWTINTVYTQSDRIFDDVDPAVYECLVSHTSGSTSFDDDRVAHPSYWVPVNLGVAPRGVWVTSAEYRPGDLAFNGGSTYVATVTHIAGVFATDLAAGKWALFAQQGASGAGSGDVTGPGSAADGNIVLFNGVTGKAIKESATALTSLAPKASPALTGTPTAPTAATVTNTTQLATTAFVQAVAAAIVAGAPAGLDTLDELSAAIGDDPAFAATIATALALKANSASAALTGNPTAPTPSPGDNDTSIATTAFVTAAIGAVSHDPRVLTEASNTTPATDTSLYDQHQITALAGAITFGVPVGSPAAGRKLIYRIKDNATARAISFNAIFRGVGLTLPTTTILSKTLYLGMIYNATDTKWDVVAASQE